MLSGGFHPTGEKHSLKFQYFNLKCHALYVEQNKQIKNFFLIPYIINTGCGHSGWNIMNPTFIEEIYTTKFPTLPGIPSVPCQHDRRVPESSSSSTFFQ